MVYSWEQLLGCKMELRLVLRLVPLMVVLQAVLWIESLSKEQVVNRAQIQSTRLAESIEVE